MQHTYKSAISKTEWREADACFANAICEGRLSQNEKSSHYAGNYMYMGTVNGRDQFKHINTREYLI